jgi:hypothetical protein
MSHDAIRHDMDLFLAAITRTKEQVDAGAKLQDWQLKAYKSLAKDLYHNVHAHHDHEEDIFFPWMETKVGEQKNLPSLSIIFGMLYRLPRLSSP